MQATKGNKLVIKSKPYAKHQQNNSDLPFTVCILVIPRNVTEVTATMIASLRSKRLGVVIRTFRGRNMVRLSVCFFLPL